MRGHQPTLNHLSLNVTWDESVDPDLEPAQLLGEGGREAKETGLARRIDGGAGAAPGGHDTRDIDDATVAAGLGGPAHHLLADKPASEHGGAQVGVED